MNNPNAIRFASAVFAFSYGYLMPVSNGAFLPFQFEILFFRLDLRGLALSLTVTVARGLFCNCSCFRCLRGFDSALHRNLEAEGCAAPNSIRTENEPDSRARRRFPDRVLADHRHFIETKAITPHGRESPMPRTNLGPDIVALEIPPSHVGTIKSMKGFYEMAGGLNAMAKGEHNYAFLRCALRSS